MTDRIGEGVSNWMERRLLRRWSEVADHAGSRGLTADERSRALALRQRLDRALRAAADTRAERPEISPHADWWWRPDAWRGALCPAAMAAPSAKTRLSDDVRLFHDCPAGEVLVRQARNLTEAMAPDFGLAVDVFRFEGSYLSLVLELPDAAIEGFRKRHVFRLDARIATDRPTEIIARLNIEHGPNTERIVRDAHPEGPALTVDFDLSLTRIDASRARRMWLDLIFERPVMNGIEVADLVVSRQPRAEV